MNISGHIFYTALLYTVQHKHMYNTTIHSNYYSIVLEFRFYNLKPECTATTPKVRLV